MTANAATSRSRLIEPRPFLKWAGGKTQIINELLSKSPQKFGKYIEPFVGGGALFFALQPKRGVIADSNPELVNAYRCVANNLDDVIHHLEKFRYSEGEFYRIRKQDFENLSPEYAAARTIYLNRTCYNGLYRVNRNGQFNVPFGKYKNPTICSYDTLEAASKTLQSVEVLHGNYKDVLSRTAKKGDFIYLDPPYLPVSDYADFKRYTKEQFYEEDHKELAKEVDRLSKLGCHVILTNSNHHLVYELYAPYDIEVVRTRRNINSKSDSRKGEDVIIKIRPDRKLDVVKPISIADKKVQDYPPTRYMGSKEKLLPYIRHAAEKFEFKSAIDLFSGSGVVSYLFKAMGKQVFSNDYMAMNAMYSKAMIENNTQKLNQEEIDSLFSVSNASIDTFVQETFSGIYFSDEDNSFIDTIRSNIQTLPSSTKQAIAMSALIRACIKKRPRGVFTYTGLRYDDGRADLKTSIEEHVRNAVDLINKAVFDNGEKNRSIQGDAMSCDYKADLVYLDPPYYSPLSDNEYVRRYHFVEGLARNWQGVDMQWNTKTKKFKNYPTPFSTHAGAASAFDKLFSQFEESILLVSYSSNSLPTREEMVDLISKHKSNVDVIDINYRYSFSNKKNVSRNDVKEYLFVGY